jgi:ribose transport system ATP-binding protein
LVSGAAEQAPARQVSDLSVEAVSKRFPGVQALDKVSFSIRTGEVHALLGENGAGKSTLLKILSGATQPDSGRITLDSKEIALRNPGVAVQAGIASIYQELSLVPYLSVAHNLFLGREAVAGRWIMSLSRLKRMAADVLARLGVRLDPTVRAGSLGMAEQQLVEICRALSRNARFILMDEPTASLTGTEIDLLFRTIETLKRSGVGILYISHRLEEIERIADRVTVMRDGCVVNSGPAGALSLPQLIASMVGRSISNHYPKESFAPGEPILEVEPDPGTDPGNRSIAFVARAGEVVGIAGLVGAGRTEWARRVFGADPSPAGGTRIAGSAVHVRSPRRARDLGIGLVPENRKEQGLLLGRTVRDNITVTILDRISRLGLFIDRSRQSEVSGRYVEKLSVKCPSDLHDVGTLSGGNQQKVVLAKWLACEGRVIILDEPTRGIDVGAKQEMYRHMNTLCREGRTVILISSDLPELLSMSDRIYVMHKGRFTAELSREEADQETVIRHASGIEGRAAV